MSKLWTTVPVFCITNVTLPDGTVDGEKVKPYSYIDTCTVPPGPGYVVVVVAAVVDGTRAETPPPSTPFIRATASPGTAQRYANFHFLPQTTSTDARLPRL